MDDLPSERFVLAGVGAIGSFGAGKDAIKELLALGPGSHLSTQQPQKKLAFPLSTARLHDFIPPHRLRRADHFSKLALTALMLALDDAGLAPEECQNSALLVASGYGPVASTCSFKDSYLDHGTLGASPTMFTKSIHNQAAAHIAIQLGVQGPVATVCQHSFPFQMALLTGCLWLREKRVQRVLVGGVDELTPFFEYCRRRYATSAENRVDALLAISDAAPGEGAAFFILEAETKRFPQTTLAMPVLGTLDDERLPFANQGCLAVHGPRPADNEWLRGQYDNYQHVDFRPLYGHYPTAAALDLAALTTVLPTYGQGTSIETGFRRHFACLRLETRETKEV